MAAKDLRKPSENLRMILARNIRSHRLKRRLSQEGLAEVCGLHRTYVGSIERGERNATLSTLEAFSEALGVTVIELLTEPKATDGQP